MNKSVSTQNLKPSLKSKNPQWYVYSSFYFKQLLFFWKLFLKSQRNINIYKCNTEKCSTPQSSNSPKHFQDIQDGSAVNTKILSAFFTVLALHWSWVKLLAP